MERPENRNDVRTSNQIQIFELLRRNKRTITEIANRLQISFTAASNILDEMQEEGLVEITSSNNHKSKRGRVPNYVSLNLNKGIVCAIDLSRDIVVSLASLDCSIIVQQTIPNVMYITKDHLEQIEKIIRELLLKEEVKNRKLLSICISSPGLIRRDNFEYADAYRVVNYSKLNPVIFFKNAFNVNVEMFNDSRIRCLAELKKGVFPKKSFNGLFVHIGKDSGLCLVINGKIFCGSNNFSGEIFSLNEIDEFSSNYNTGKIYGFWDMTKDLKKAKNLPFHIDDEINVDEFVNSFNAKDPVVMDIVDKSCKINAISLDSLCTLLDLDTIVIEGPILKFGEEYLKKLRKYMVDYSQIEIRTHIIASSTIHHSSTIGACYEAVSSYLYEEIQEMSRKRLGQPDFELGDGHRDI